MTTIVNKRLGDHERILYVRTDGSDENDGTSDSRHGAFRTWQRGVDVLSRSNVQRGTVWLKAGDEDGPRIFSENIKVGPLGYAGRLILRGAESAPTTLTCESGDTLIASLVGNVQVQLENAKISSPNGNAIKVEYQTLFSIGSGVNFGVAKDSHIWVHDSQAMLQILAAKYTISGDCARHVLIQYGHLYFEANRLKLIGSPTFAGAFLTCYPRGSVQATENVIEGAGHGKRFDIHHMSVLNLCGGKEEIELAGDEPGYIDSTSIRI